MTIPQPLQGYCDSFMSLLVSTVIIQDTKWWQSLYTDINRRSLDQCWYEHAIIFPTPGDSTEFCVELNYEPKLGLRCAYGIRKDKPKKHKYDVSLVVAFKSSSPAPYFEAEKYSSYKLQERLDPNHWIVWRFLPLSFISMNLIDMVSSKNVISEEDISISIKPDVNVLVSEINKFFNDWRNIEC